MNDAKFSQIIRKIRSLRNIKVFQIFQKPFEDRPFPFE